MFDFSRFAALFPELGLEGDPAATAGVMKKLREKLGTGKEEGKVTLNLTLYQLP